MGRLFTFGCSFTEDFENVVSSYNNSSFTKTVENRPAQIKYIEDYLNGEVPESWSKILGRLLNKDVVNYGHGGKSNYDIFERVCEQSHQFSKDDIVIVGWTHFMRFRWPTQNGWSPMFTHYIENMGSNYIDKETHEKIIISRDNRCVVEEIYNFQKLLINLSLKVGFKLYFWSACYKIINGENYRFKNNPIYLINDLLKYTDNFFGVLKEHGSKTITEETNGLIKDPHLGKIGHEVQAKLFYEYILSR